MSKLHEKLAVKSGLAAKVRKHLSDLVVNLISKPHLFGFKSTVFTPIKEGADPVIEEQGSLQATVVSELHSAGVQFGQLVDICHSINVSNTQAKADVIVDGETILENIPSTDLLELEKLVTEFKAVINAVPVLDPAKGFVEDHTQGVGIYKSREIVKPRTQKEKAVLVMYEATDKHPAQTQVYDRDVVIGTIRQNEWSAMYTPARKAQVLNNIDRLLEGIKAAISRANDTTASEEKIGSELVKYIFG